MSIKATVWAFTQDISPGQLAALIAIADEANSDGVCFTGQDKLAWKACFSSKRSLQRHIVDFRKMGLLHTERRNPKFAGGRLTDAIILHLDVTGEKKPYPGQAAIEAQKKRDREKFEVNPEDSEPVENGTEGLGDKMSPSRHSNDPGLGDKMSPRGVKATNQVGLGDNLGQNDPGAFKRNACGLTRQSVPGVGDDARTDPVDNSETGRTDRRTDGTEDSSSISSRPVRGVDLSKLRGHLGNKLSSVTDEALAVMVEIVLDRASGPVRSPLKFASAAIGREPDELLSQAEAQLHSREADEDGHAWDELVAQAQQQFGSGSEPERKTCPVHGTEYTTVCAACRSEAIAAPVESAETNPVDVKRFLAEVRAGRTRGGDR
ncbi:MAG: helix-turn-helix domain-containing protein [Kocuria sp.]|nr:helix-turn-helix domain-containing protein [Kocuria sp.]